MRKWGYQEQINLMFWLQNASRTKKIMWLVGNTAVFLFFARCQYWADLPHHRHQTEFPIQTQNPLALGEYSRTVLKILKQWHEDSFIKLIII